MIWLRSLPYEVRCAIVFAVGVALGYVARAIWKRCAEKEGL